MSQQPPMHACTESRASLSARKCQPSMHFCFTCFIMVADVYVCVCCMPRYRSRSVPTAPPHTPSLSSRTSLTRSHAASLVALPMAWDTRHVLKNEDSSAVWRPLVKPGDPSGGTLWKPITRAPSKHLLATHAPRGGHASATAMLASTAPAQGVYAQRGVDGGRRVSEFSGGRVDDRMVDTEPVERHTANGRFAGLSQAIARGMMASGGVTQTSSVRGF